MRSYLDLLETILTKGRRRGSPRHPASTLAIVGEQLRFDLSQGFPLVTTRQVHLRGAIEELLWFLSGSTNNEDLVAKKVHIWDKWAAPADVCEKTALSYAARRALYFQQLTIDQQQAVWDDYDSGIWRPTEAVLDEHHVPTSTTNKLIRKGDCGPIYGKMWRHWPNPDGSTTDQIALLIESLRSAPYSRRHVVTAWNPSVLPDQKLSPIANVHQGRQSLAACHATFQFFVEPLSLAERNVLLNQLSPAEYTERFGLVAVEMMAAATDPAASLDLMKIPRDRLSCKLYARSQDVPVGTVFNIIGYAALTAMLAQQLGFVPGEYIHSMGDCHIYEDQIDLAREQLKREPRPLPTLHLRDGVPSLFAYRYDDFILSNYHPHPKLDYPVTE